MRNGLWTKLKKGNSKLKKLKKEIFYKEILDKNEESYNKVRIIN